MTYYSLQQQLQRLLAESFHFEEVAKTSVV